MHVFQLCKHLVWPESDTDTDNELLQRLPHLKPSNFLSQPSKLTRGESYGVSRPYRSPMRASTNCVPSRHLIYGPLKQTIWTKYQFFENLVWFPNVCMQNGKPIARQSNIKYEDLQIGRWGCHSKTKNKVMGCARDNFSQHGLLVVGHRSRTIRRCMIVSQCLEHRMHKKFYKVRTYELHM